MKFFAAWKSLPAFQSNIYSVLLCFGRSLAFMVCGDWQFLFSFLENFVDLCYIVDYSIKFSKLGR